ncbi:alkaline phosphatase family protein [Agromyces aerolatus]|uniref:alkaline phosphatase family protein n=1 Tax=Agromyces sp. LY-1074 TaxID=3074080 RepID=UPI0028590263|nr:MULTISPECIES: alkaline phosphatase family protein [unclassified Agromyces]MDR5701439.1 alkaline phosphatase family protein [Agromyces sp. LY-1074]MDR5706772.1 alkaline phosphatase family protein [Agromyces sp. LY-1358]
MADGSDGAEGVRGERGERPEHGQPATERADRADRADRPEPADRAERAHSRRDFLKFGGVAAGGAVVGGAAGFAAGRAAGSGGGAGPGESARPGHTVAATPPGTIPPRAGGPGWDHLVVVMFENRSFDNLLGHLYAADELPAGQTFAGLQGDPIRMDGPHGRSYETHAYTGTTDEIMSSPRPDPGEDYPHVNTQLFGTVDPKRNAERQVAQMEKPYNAPAPGSEPTMRGFVHDYHNAFHMELGRVPTADELEMALGGFTPDMMPVLSTLAKGFAVFDGWHCAVPGPTFCNRSFFHASTSHGYVTNHDNGGTEKWYRTSAASPTVFNRLDEAGISWAVYYDDSQHVSMTGLIHKPVLERFWHTNFFPMSDFYRAVADGALPAYAFVEPRMLYDHNDMHPPVGTVDATVVDGANVTGGAISDVRAGEALLHEIYTSVRTSASATGSNASNTMLLVVFDEHGGTFDHVPPPAATPPGDGAPGEMDFTFDRLGLRVPAIAVSAYTAAGTIVHDAVHHGSLISTLTGKYDLEPLTKRDDGAPTIAGAVTLDTPRPATDWPHTHPQYTPRNPEAADPVPEGHDDQPLTPPGRNLMGLLKAHAGTDDALPKTWREAHAFVERHGIGLFGPQ